MFNKAFNFGKNRFTKMTNKRLMQLFDQFGITPRAGANTQSRFMAGAEDLAGRAPSGANTMQRAAEKFIAEIETALGGLKTQFGKATDAETAGQVLRTAFAGKHAAFKARQEKLYDKAYLLPFAAIGDHRYLAAGNDSGRMGFSNQE